MTDENQLSIALQESRRRLPGGLLILLAVGSLALAVRWFLGYSGWMVWLMLALAAFRPLGDALNIVYTNRRLAMLTIRPVHEAGQRTTAVAARLDGANTSTRDSPIGLVARDPDDALWKATITYGSAPLTISISGAAVPDANSMAHAHALVSNLPEFIGRVQAFLSRASEHAQWREYASEINAISVEEVSFCWPDRPGDGMIYFSSRVSPRLWRCDLIAGEPRSLGFDD